MSTSSTFGRYARRWFLIAGVLELILAAVLGVFGLLDPGLASGFLLAAAALGVTGAVMVAVGLRAAQAADDAERVLRIGLPGTATVTALTRTGVSMDDQPQVVIDLLVEVPGLAGFAARRTEIVPQLLLVRLAPGARLPVRIDPRDQALVVIDWASAGEG